MRLASSFQRAPRWTRHPGAALLLVILLAGLGAVFQLAFTAHHALAAGPHVDTVTFDRDVDPASAHFLTDAIDTANSDGATVLIVSLDTPGGDLESMKTIVQKELASAIPIVVYVTPQGGRAASAGTFLALAAPIVAMAPNTRIGAASPIDSSGNDIPSTLDRKLKNDLEAQIRGIQTTFHRNVDLAIATVETAASYDDQQAIAQNLVNFGAGTQTDLLNQIDGMSVTLANGSNVTIHTAGLPTEELTATFANQLETVFLDPTLLFILFAVAAVCIYLELSHPGAIVPGTIGAIALIIFLFGSGSLNPNWAGLILMLLSIVLLAIDVRVPTHGVLTAGALVSLVVGSLIFFDTGSAPGTGAQGVSPVVVLATAVGVGLVSLTVISYAIRVRLKPIHTGSEGLLGQVATVVAPLAPSGRVSLLGEDWAARLDGEALKSGIPIEAEQKVRVVARDGLTLIVQPLQPSLSSKRSK